MNWWFLRKLLLRGESTTPNAEPQENTEADAFASTLVLDWDTPNENEDDLYTEKKKQIIRALRDTEQSLLSAGIDVFSRSGANAFDESLAKVYPPSEMARKVARERGFSGILLLSRTEKESRRLTARGGKLAVEEGLKIINAALCHPGGRAKMALRSVWARREYYHVFYRGKNGLNTTRPFDQLAMLAFQLPDDTVLTRIEDTTLLHSR